MNLLPSRPLRLEINSLNKNRRRMWPLLLSLVIGCGLLAFSVDLGKDNLEERALWARGVPGEVTHVSGETTESRNFFLWDYNYNLNVTYLDATGKRHDGTVKFTYLFSRLDENAPVELRYDPTSPNYFVLNWQAEGGWPRWGMFALVCVLGVCVLSVIPLTIRKGRQLNALLEKVARDGEELWVEVVNLRYVNGVLFINYLMPDAGEKEMTKKKQMLSVPPLIVPRDDKDFAIALRSPREPKRLYFVPDDLGPFVFSAEEKLGIAQMLASYRKN